MILICLSYINSSHVKNNQNRRHCVHSCSVLYCIEQQSVMSETLKLFTYIRKFYHRLGIHSPDPYINRSYNWRNLFILLCLTTLFVMSTAFLTFKSDTVVEFGTSFYVSTTGLLYLIFWLMIIHKVADLFILMRKIDEFVAKSK